MTRTRALWHQCYGISRRYPGAGWRAFVRDEGTPALHSYHVYLTPEPGAGDAIPVGWVWVDGTYDDAREAHGLAAACRMMLAAARAAKE